MLGVDIIIVFWDEFAKFTKKLQNINALLDLLRR